MFTACATFTSYHRRRAGHQQRCRPVRARLAHVVRFALQNSSHGGRRALRAHAPHDRRIRRACSPSCSQSGPGAPITPALDALTGRGALGTVIASGHSGRDHGLALSAAGGFVGACRPGADFLLHRRVMALFTGRRWVEEVPQVEMDKRRPSLVTLTLLSIFMLVRPIVSGSDVPPSRSELVAARAQCGRSGGNPHLDRPFARCRFIPRSKPCGVPRSRCCGLLITQLCLGFLAFLTRVAWGRDAVQPELPMVVSTVAHVAVGALLLATAVVLAIQVWRHVPVAFEERVSAAPGKPVVAST